MTVQIIKHQVKDNEKVTLCVDTKWVNCLCLKTIKSQSCQFIEPCLLICTINFVVELDAIYLII